MSKENNIRITSKKNNWKRVFLQIPVLIAIAFVPVLWEGGKVIWIPTILFILLRTLGLIFQKRFLSVELDLNKEKIHLRYYQYFVLKHVSCDLFSFHSQLKEEYIFKAGNVISWTLYSNNRKLIALDIEDEKVPRIEVEEFMQKCDSLNKTNRETAY